MEGNLKTTSEIFHEAFPIYLAMGMTYEQFWEKESWLVKSYREAYRIKQDEINHSAWLNGLYMLRALQSGIPVYLNGIVKSKIDLPEYPNKPLEFGETNKEKQEEKQMELQIAKMREMAEQFNKTFGMKKKE